MAVDVPHLSFIVCIVALSPAMPAEVNLQQERLLAHVSKAKALPLNMGFSNTFLLRRQGLQ